MINFINKIEQDLAQSKHNQNLEQYDEKEKLFPRCGIGIVSTNLPYDYNYKEYLKENYKDLDIENFIKDSDKTIESILSNIINHSLYKNGDKYILNKQIINPKMEILFESIKNNKVSYSICFRLLNITINEELVLEKNDNETIYLRPLDNNIINIKYPKNPFVNNLFRQEYWVKHNLELVIEKKIL